MRVVIDVEANGYDPDKIWVVVCKDIDTGEYHVFKEQAPFLDFAASVLLWVGHNFLAYDYPVLNRIWKWTPNDIASHCLDTLICSKLIDYPRETGHSIASYGLEFGLEKIDYTDFTKYSKELEEYCIRDVDITHKIYNKYYKYIHTEEHKASIQLEHSFQLHVINVLHNNGFSFNTAEATKVLNRVIVELDTFDKKITEAFPAKCKLVREIHPKETKHGTLSRTDFRWVKGGDLSQYNGGPFCRCDWVSFNPASHKQIVDVLSSAGWSPIDKTQTHIDTERELSRLKYVRNKTSAVDLSIQICETKKLGLQKYGWKINENNLATLPDTAPLPARLLAQRILYEARRRTLTEWLGLVNPDTDRIHGTFQGIGAWTHRMAHQRPNLANIPNEYDTQGNKKLLGKEMRSLWQAPRKRLLVGVDAEGIQLRIFAHYIDDKEFTDALVKGSKSEKTDPHSLNQRVLGDICKSRAAAKRFVYALLLGAGIGKLAQILECDKPEAQRALDHLLERYQGFAHLKQAVIPVDARRGYFIGLDHRKVRIPGETVSQRSHLCMSGYLQNGEKIIMGKATLKFLPELKHYDSFLVNLVHDEWQAETPNDMTIATTVGKLMADSLPWAGEELGLKCPLAGSYWNDDLKDYTIGKNWSVTH